MTAPHLALVPAESEVLVEPTPGDIVIVDVVDGVAFGPYASEDDAMTAVIGIARDSGRAFGSYLVAAVHAPASDREAAAR